MIKGILKLRNVSLFTKMLFSIVGFTMRIKHVNKVIFAHLNINSLGNKFECFLEFSEGKVDILTVLEKKNDESFPLG